LKEDKVGGQSEEDKGMSAFAIGGTCPASLTGHFLINFQVPLGNNARVKTALGNEFGVLGHGSASGHIAQNLFDAGAHAGGIMRIAKVAAFAFVD
jgi:hypothetical protein